MQRTNAVGRTVCREPLHHVSLLVHSSTSFANPAVTIARSLSDTFAGIAPTGVLAFITAQLAGMLAAVVVGRWLWRE